MSEELDVAYLNSVTAELRASGWYPRRAYLCGCQPERLCAAHAERRAVDHYHPETVR